MAPKKLTEADKKSILKLYREPEETTSTLADRYGVSNSTISRLLKASLPAKEYSRLIQQKRSSADRPAASGKAKVADTAQAAPVEAAPPEAPSQPESPLEEVPAKTSKPAPVLKKKRDATDEAVAVETVPAPRPAPESEEQVTPAKRTRRRSIKTTQPAEETGQLSLPEPEEVPEPPKPSPKEPPKLKSERAPAEVDEDEVTDAIPTDWDDVSTLDDDYDEDEDEDEDYDEEGESWEGDDTDTAPHLEKLEIAPLAEASLPRLCYVVVERSSSELVALPLRTFGHLGEIPETEGESRTLPIFDNHRVARRFSRRNQRVVKLPDGGLLQTTSPYLMAKGITRLLIDGQVFALEDDGDYEDEADFE
jgi:transposase-like protein